MEDNIGMHVRRKKVNQTPSGLPCVLTIAGSDSGGGAGIQADLKTFAALGVHGTSAITCITAQNPMEVHSIQSVKTGMVRDQIEAVLKELKPIVAKTGMLYSKAIIDVVCESIPKSVALVVDPVMISTSGAVLLKPAAVGAMRKVLVRASVATPNLHEAEYLLNRTIRTVEDLRESAREFHDVFGCAALMKGGHLPGRKVAVDFLYDGESEWVFEAPYVKGISTHGTGCTYSAAVAACLAQGHTLVEAVHKAKDFISNAIAQSYKTSGHYVLNTEWTRK